MKRTLDRGSLDKLDAIYGFRILRAEKHVQEQRGVLAGIAVEIAERRGKVEGFTHEIERNDRHMRDPSISSDARHMERALRYRHWLDYDRQRAAFYLELTEQELVEAQGELRRRVDSLTRTRARQSTVDGLSREADLQEALAEELAVEEDNDGLRGRHGEMHVQE